MKVLLFALLVFLFRAECIADVSDIQMNSITISGVVKNEKGEIISGANILIVENNKGASSDFKGSFTIKNILPGEYTLKISYVGFETSFRKVIVAEGDAVQVIVVLSPSYFQIGGIEVIASSELLPGDPSTKTLITSGEIEHYQASSIKDVLDLVPGVQRTDNPGLERYGQIAIRGNVQDKVSSFGTLILLDGVPVTNNADMQFEKPTGPEISSPSLMSGIDLRIIPADNIETIEVLTGLPSVKYGDFTEGVINIRTKTGLQPHRLKIKDNPDTREANIGGSFSLSESGSGINYNFNAARSERDIRVDGDEYTRFTVQTGYFHKLLRNTLLLNHKFITQLISDEERPEGDLHQTFNYNRGFSLGYNSWGTYELENTGSIDFNLFANVQRENSMKSRLVQSDLRVLPNGDTVAVYLGKVETKGFEWNTGGKLNWNETYFTGNIIHKVILGGDLQYNANTGEGILFDTLYSYYGPDAGKRPYSFSSIPGQTLLSFYAEDQITANFIFDYKISIGARYDMYRPYKFNIRALWGEGDLIQSHQGSFFNPRFNMMIIFTKNSQVRLTAGRTSKSPAMGIIYPPEEVFRWRNPVTSEISHFRYDQTSPDLKGITEAQYEISYDHGFSENLAGSASFYYKERRGETRALSVPVFFVDEVNNKPRVYYIDKYTRQINSGWNISKGVEFTLKSNRIKSLNMNFQITGSYNFLNGSDAVNILDTDYDISKGQYPNYKVMDTLIGFIYPKSGKWNDRIQFNYYVRYTLPPLGLWISLRAENVLQERAQNYNVEPEDYNLLTDAGKLSYIFNRKVRLKGSKWLFNINISKSLYKGAEVSFYVNNFLDDPAVRTIELLPGVYGEEVRNPELFYGIEFSTIIDEMF